MPPWYAGPGAATDPSTAAAVGEERETVVHWVKSGMASGDDSKLPKPPRTRSRRRGGSASRTWCVVGPDHDLPAEGGHRVQVRRPAARLPDGHLGAGRADPARQPAGRAPRNLAYFKLGEKFSESNFITGTVPGGEPMTLDQASASASRGVRCSACRSTTSRPARRRRSTISVGLKYASGTIDKQLRNLLFVDTKFAIPPRCPAHRGARRAGRCERTRSASGCSRTCTSAAGT